jgi:hypothetical protein
MRVHGPKGWNFGNFSQPLDHPRSVRGLHSPLTSRWPCPPFHTLPEPNSVLIDEGRCDESHDYNFIVTGFVLSGTVRSPTSPFSLGASLVHTLARCKPVHRSAVWVSLATRLRRVRLA